MKAIAWLSSKSHYQRPVIAAGLTNVRRYQLGITQIELEGILQIYKIDQTALFFDARKAADFAKASLPGTHNVQADQLATDGLKKAPMPSNDFNTRIVLSKRYRRHAHSLT